MPSDLLNIGRSGAAAARTALDVTAQNIANANNEDYSRRSLSLSDVSATGRLGYYESTVPSGVTVERIQRSDSVFLQSEARRTGSDVARAQAELSGLRSAETAVEQSGLYPALVEFEAALGQLRADPLDSAARAVVLEQGRALAESFGIADRALVTSGEQIRFAAGVGVETVNTAAQELARINTALVRTKPGTSAHVTLLDQRDAQLNALSDQIGLAVSYEPSGAANVQLGDASGPFLVQQGSTSALALTTNSDGTISFTIGGASTNPASGALVGQALALVSQRDLGSELDTLAAQLIATVNAAQANGTAPDGSAGQPFFNGTSASDIAVTLASGGGIATAPTGAIANSRDTGNLDALRAALANGGPTSAADQLLSTLSTQISTRGVTAEALETLAESAQVSLQVERGVDLDTEAANLVRYQQAFQASGRVIQTAAEIFDTILGIR